MPLYLITLLRSLILLNGIWGCSAAAYFSSWLSIELNMLLFLPLILLGASSYRRMVALKYVLTQSVAGLLIITRLVQLGHRHRGSGIERILMCLFLFKLGAFPFFQWVLLLGEKLEWYSLYLLLTVQKLLPLFLIRHLTLAGVSVVCCFRWIIIPLLTITFKPLKKIIVGSSVFRVILLLITLDSASGQWKPLLLLYSLIRVPLISLSGITELDGGAVKAGRAKIKSFIFLLAFLVIIGVPPFPGFFLKLPVFILLLSISGVLEAMVLASGAAGIIIVYVFCVTTSWLKTPRMSLRALTPNSRVVIAGALLLSGIVFV